MLHALRPLLPLALLAGTAAAQWSTDPAAHVSVADGAGDQILPKVVAATSTLEPSTGDTWVSWFDGLATGYDVRIQRLDSSGNEAFLHGGILVADRDFTSVQDYGLGTTSDGGAIVAYRASDGLGTQVFATKVRTTGAIAWTTQLTATTDFVASPKVSDSTDLFNFVAWTQGNEVRVQRLTSAGQPYWAAPVVFTPPGGSYAVADVRSAVIPEGIVSIVHQTGGFGSPRRLRAQKLDHFGNLLWGPTPVDVFSSGSLQIGNFPSFTHDGAGGAVFAWYDVGGPQLQCRVQRLLAGGTAAFPAGGVPVSTNAVRQRVSPSAAFDAAAGDTYVFWEELDSTQALSGLYGQRLDASGNRLWTDDGIAYEPLGPTQVSQVRTVHDGSTARVFWNSSPGFGQDVVRGMSVDPAGAVGVGPAEISSTPSGKSRLAAAAVLASSSVANPFTVLAWSDDRVDSGDVLAQDVLGDGTLGAGAGVAFYCTAKPSSAGCATGIATSDPTRRPVSGAGGYSVDATQVHSGKNGLVFVGVTGPAALPFSGGTLCVNPPQKRGPIQNAANYGAQPCDGSYSTTVNDGQLVPAGLDPGPGNSAWYQYWYRDPGNGAGTLGTALSNAVRLDFL